MEVNKTREKLLLGIIEPVILNLLREGPTHGYAMISSIRQKYGVYFGPSTIYPTLAGMERRLLIKSQWDLRAERPRKVYTLTVQGEKQLMEECIEIRAITQPILEARAH
jgi:PadR family transcriptional regulator PadR